MSIPTMQIVGQDGQPLIINASDFDASIHKVYGETEAKPQPKAEPKTITMKGRDSGANR